jgi:exodeoxyribonuclease VII small subunit
MAGREQKDRKFEDALAELESVVEKLESGELSLDESLKIFEQGVRLVKFCNEKLGEVEKKIDLLVKDKEGKLQLKPFDEPPVKDAEDETE